MFSSSTAAVDIVYSDRDRDRDRGKGKDAGEGRGMGRVYLPVVLSVSAPGQGNLSAYSDICRRAASLSIHVDAFGKTTHLG